MPVDEFRYEGGFITGHGLTIPAPSGFAALGADQLNRLVRLLRDQKMLGDDDATRILAQEKRDRDRIEAAKDALIEDLGIEHAPIIFGHADALNIGLGVQGCVCGFRPSNGSDNGDELALHLAMARLKGS